MTFNAPFSLVLVLALLRCTAAWISPSLSSLSSLSSTAASTTTSFKKLSTALNVVQDISLETLENHEEEGATMALSVAAWLDAEWMPQEVHVQMGESAKKSYIACREAGENEVMSIMMEVAGDLEANWKQYDKDAFVNAWDVANYVSDYLTQKAGNEACDCTTPIH